MLKKFRQSRMSPQRSVDLQMNQLRMNCKNLLNDTRVRSNRGLHDRVEYLAEQIDTTADVVRDMAASADPQVSELFQVRTDTLDVLVRAESFEQVGELIGEMMVAGGMDGTDLEVRITKIPPEDALMVGVLDPQELDERQITISFDKEATPVLEF